MSTILVTGGAGYIGSHVSAALLAAGYDVVVLDDFSNASPLAIERVNALGHGAALVVAGDCRDGALLDRLFAAHDIAAAIHMAGLKAVGESVARPQLYYDVNLGCAVALLGAMERANVDCLLFSSSATVYGDPATVPVPETAAVGPVNPYGRTKLMIERMIADVAAARPGMRSAALRYFNPVGAHPSGTIGEDPRGAVNNLFPLIAQTAVGRRPEVLIHGDDWPTPDGTGVRDYIHVMDLAEGHVAALAHLLALGTGGHLVVNLGMGRGVSVREAIAAFAAASGRDIPHRVAARRAGDVAVVYADPSLANRLLGWKAIRDLAEICRDHWAWQSANPDGYV